MTSALTVGAGGVDGQRQKPELPIAFGPVRCDEEPCPECSARMLREGSRHHQLWLDKLARESAPGTRAEAIT